MEMGPRPMHAMAMPRPMEMPPHMPMDMHHGPPRPTVPEHPLHQLSCLLFFSASLLVVFMFLRALFRACCAKPAPPKKIAVIPPSPSAGRLASVPVQVAEPLCALKV